VDHFTGVNPKERYDNDLLNELRTMNKLLTELLRHHVQMPENKVVKKVAKKVIKPAVTQRRRKGVV
jgi:hypothetical protein